MLSQRKKRAKKSGSNQQTQTNSGAAIAYQSHDNQTITIQYKYLSAVNNVLLTVSSLLLNDCPQNTLQPVLDNLSSYLLELPQKETFDILQNTYAPADIFMTAKSLFTNDISKMQITFMEENYDQVTLLELACIFGNINLVMLLLRLGANPNQGKWLALNLAITQRRENHEMICNVLINNNVINQNSSNKFRVETYHKANPLLTKALDASPLMHALKMKSVKLMKLFVDDIKKHYPKSRIPWVNMINDIFSLDNQNSQTSEMINAIFNTFTSDNFFEPQQAVNIYYYLVMNCKYDLQIMILNKLINSNAIKDQKIHYHLKSILLAMVSRPLNINACDVLLQALNIDLNKKIFSLHPQIRSGQYDIADIICCTNEKQDSIAWLKFLMERGKKLNFTNLRDIVLNNSIDVAKFVMNHGEFNENDKEQCKITLYIYNRMNMFDALFVPTDKEKEARKKLPDMPEIPVSIFYDIVENKQAVISFLKNHDNISLTNHVFYILYRNCYGDEKNIIETIKTLLPVLKPFSEDPGYDNKTLFNALLIKNNFKEADLIYSYFKMKGIDMESKLLESREFLRSKFSNANFPGYKNAVDMISNLLESYPFDKPRSVSTLMTSNAVNKLSSSYAYCRNNGITFYQKEKVKLSSRSKSMIIKNTLKDVSSKKYELRNVTYFNGKNLDYNSSFCREIENKDMGVSNIFFIPEIDQHANQFFEKKSRYYFGKKCLKKLSGIKTKFKVIVAGENHDLEITHELKSQSTDDRIIIAKIASDDKKLPKYLACMYIKNGLHTTDAVQKLLSFNQTNPVDISFIVENHNNTLMIKNNI